jgi:hypothetical protein
MRALVKILPGLFVGLTLSAAVGAQTLTVGSASGNPGGATTPAQVPVSFTRNPAVPVADFTFRINYATANLNATAAGVNGGGCSVNDASGFIVVLPPAGLTDVQTNTYCDITFTIDAAAPAPSTQNLTFSTPVGGGCFDATAEPVPCTFVNGAITVTVPPLGPSIAYNPAAGASAGSGGPVNFTGVTAAGTTGSGVIVATPSGGAASGTTTVGGFSLSGANAANFTLTSAATLTFTAGVATPQNITLTCTSAATARTANLQATETINGGATSTRFWVLNCPAGAQGPALAYNPSAGAAAGTGGPVNFTGVTTAGTTGSGQIVATPSGGTLAGTTTLSGFTLSGADAASFTRTSAATLTFTAGVVTAQNITLTCISGSVARTANLQATETISGGATSTRFWVLNCPAGALGPTLAYSPAAGASAGTGGPVSFTGVTTVGTTGNGQIVATPSGGALAATTTLGSFAISGADAASFTRTSAATLTFTAGVVTAQNITLTCTSGATARTANLQATETVTGGATSTRFWVLNCPAGGAVGPTLAYNPAAGAAAGSGGPVNFTGVTAAGSTGAGQIVVTPSGGLASGATTLTSFTISGADAASFTRTSAATLTFTAGVVTAQNITLTCTAGSVARSANLQATETITGGATSTRFWVLNCPAGALGPALAYNPAAGASAGSGGPVNFTGVTTLGSIGNGQIVATPSGGAVSGTTTLSSFTISGADAASFTRTSAATLTFTAGVVTAQSITLTCTSGATARTANLQATETVTGGATSSRFWVLSCPAGGAVVGPALNYSPAAGAAAGTGGPVNFTGVNGAGSTGTGVITATPSGGTAAGTTTLGSFTLSGASAANFALTSASTLTFTAGVNTPQNITLSCIAGLNARSANLQATETVTGGATSQRFWVLICPAGPDQMLQNGFEDPNLVFGDGFEGWDEP